MTTRLPQAVGDYLQTLALKRRSPAFFRLDGEGRILDWGGHLDRYGLAPPRQGLNASEILYFLEGLLPLEDAEFQMLCLQTQPGVFLDLHLFRDEGGSWVLLLDASEEARQREQLLAVGGRT